MPGARCSVAPNRGCDKSFNAAMLGRRLLDRRNSVHRRIHDPLLVRLTGRIVGNAAATSGLASGNDASTKEIASSSALMSQSAIVLYVPTPHVFGTGKQWLV